MGRNFIELDFEAAFVNNCEGMQWFKDSSDGNEYIYSDSEPDHAHHWFPCFDQPDLKAPYTLLALCEPSWIVVSTAEGEEIADPKQALKTFGVSSDMIESFAGEYKTF